MRIGFDAYLYIGAKLVVGFLCLLAYINISGRGQLAPHSASDQIGNYVLGGVIGGVIYNPDVRITEMMVVIALWTVLVLFNRWLKGRSRTARRLIDGRPLLLFSGGKLNAEGLRLANITARDLIAGLRLRGIHRLDELDTVWVETNGQYTVQKKGEDRFATSFIEDGAPVHENLRRHGKDVGWLRDRLGEKGVDEPGDVALAEWHTAEKPEGELDIYLYR